MLQIRTENTEKELIDFIQRWFDLIAIGRIDEACRKLDQPNCYGISWNAELIIAVVRDEFGPETIYGREHPEGVLFTAVQNTRGIYNANVYKLDDGSGFSVDHDVPLNGEWSDLTAQFEFVGTAAEFQVILHDLHVM